MPNSEDPVLTLLRGNLPNLEATQPGHVADSAVEEIVRAISSKGWRRSSLDPHSTSDLHDKVLAAAAAGTRLEFSVPFGGYKGWQTRHSPHLNWADIFCLAYLRTNGLRIAAAHRPGVAFRFSYCSGVLDLVSNYPTAWQDTYIREMKRVMGAFSDAAVEFSVVDIAELCGGPHAARDEILRNLHDHEALWLTDSDDTAHRIASASRNLVPRGVEDLSPLTPDEWQQRVRQSAALCEALDSLQARRQYNKYSSRIQLVFIRGPVPSVHVGSCRSSSLHPWIAEGVVDLRDGGSTAIESMLGPTAGPSANLEWREVRHEISLDPVFADLPGLAEIAIRKL